MRYSLSFIQAEDLTSWTLVIEKLDSILSDCAAQLCTLDSLDNKDSAAAKQTACHILRFLAVLAKAAISKRLFLSVEVTHSSTICCNGSIRVEFLSVWVLSIYCAFCQTTPAVTASLSLSPPPPPSTPHPARLDYPTICGCDVLMLNPVIAAVTTQCGLRCSMSRSRGAVQCVHPCLFSVWRLE